MTAYLGAREANAAVGGWPSLLHLGSDFQINRYGGGDDRGRRFEGERRREWGGNGGWGGGGYGGGYGAPYQQPAYRPAYNPGVVRDHRVGAAVAVVQQALADNGWNPAYGFPPRAALIEQAPPTMANRQVLPMNTGTTPVPPTLTAQITSRPQRVAFRPERVFVSAADIGGSGSASNWIINDITIGNRSQFAQSGALPGDMFANTAIDSFVTFETAQTAMDVVMIVTYQGATEGGTPFYGSIIGTAAV
jgi:hypothetical protein